MKSLLLALLCVAAPVSAGEPGFAEKPSAVRDGDKVQISFAVSAFTDAEVAALDKGGRIVRHLAAGLLGPNAPEPFQKNSLKQAIMWDGTDDAGKPVAAATLRVRLGIKPQFDGFLLYEPDAMPDVAALAVGPAGNVYVFYPDPTANGNQGGHKVRIIDRQGKHVRQILPFPADLPYDKVKATGAFQDTDGSTVPHCHNWHSLNFYPDTVATRGRSMSDFNQPVVDAAGRLYWIITGGRLCAIDADGGIPYDTFLSDRLFPELRNPCGRPALALSSDGKYLYASGIGDGMYENVKPVPCVWRIDVATRKAEIFLGDPKTPGREKDRFTSPRGVAVAQGLLYVADPDAGRIAVFKEDDKSFVAEMKVTLPHIVQVHPKTGAVYVCSYVPEAKPNPDGRCRIKDANLLKFADYKAEKPACQIALPHTGLSPNGGTHRIALDPTADPPLVWAPGLAYAQKGRQIACYRDTGTAFEAVEIKPPAGPWGNGPRDLLFDRARSELYVKVQGERWLQFDEKTGNIVRTVKFPLEKGGPYMGSSGSQLGVDSAGNYITHCWGDKSGLMRWTRDLSPFNWDGQTTHRSDWGGMMTFQLNYMAVRNDEIYVIKPVNGPHHLDVYDMGLNQKRRVVWNVRRGSCPRVDAKGNIYITVPIRPLDRDLPEFFDGKLDKLPDLYNNIGAGHYWYLYMQGSIVKFPPAGGAFIWIENDREKNDLAGLPDSVKAKPRQKFQYFMMGHYPHKVCEVQGAEWVRFGYSPYSETYPAGTPVCMCEGTGFDVDPYGRVFYPDLCRFRVEMIDAANNPIGHFGAYGNQDSAGPASKVKKPDIPLAWPTYVAVSDTHAYVNDTVGMRVVKVKLGATAEETCDVR